MDKIINIINNLIEQVECDRNKYWRKKIKFK